VQEGRAEAQQRWGSPTAGPPQEAIEHGARAAEDAAFDRRNYKGVLERTTALMRAGRIKV
jgi:hypothetical protein